MIHTIIATLFGSKKARDADIRRWAEIEYKKDADFAYNYMTQHGFMPDLKLNR
jgi:hypothetical protein